MKQYFCVGSYLPFQSINKSQLNNSTAKQTFSFSKSKRFSDYKPNCTVVAYSSNDFKARKQGPFMGSSQRQPVIVPNGNPSPAKYNTRTEPAQHNISFGLGRESVKAYNYLNVEACKFPSSTKYEVTSNFKNIYQKAPVYTLKKRHRTQAPLQTSPGPAGYNLNVGRNCSFELTKYKSISFSTTKSRRFKNSQTQAPGPGAYREPGTGDERFRGGTSSRFHSSLGTRFSHARRKTYIDDKVKEKASLPGPGNYQSPSQFGQYDGDIYKTFEIAGKKSSNFIYLETDSRPATTHKSKRPLTSKH